LEKSENFATEDVQKDAVSDFAAAL